MARTIRKCPCTKGDRDHLSRPEPWRRIQRTEAKAERRRVAMAMRLATKGGED